LKPRSVLSRDHLHADLAGQLAIKPGSAGTPEAAAATRDVKIVPGRAKTDLDAIWLCKLAER
jgi:hypothetical protein